jgi:hypothetical protein
MKIKKGLQILTMIKGKWNGKKIKDFAIAIL